MTDETYRSRCQAELEHGVPRWPCPICGRGSWHVLSFRKDLPTASPVTCNHCHVLMDAHWIDGAWFGMHAYAKYPGSVAQFSEEHALYLEGVHP